MYSFVINGEIGIIDDCDLDLLRRHKWCLNKGTYNHSYYVMYGKRVGKKVEKKYLHRLVVGAEKGDKVTFVSTNTMDCRRCNLRLNGRRLKNVETS